MSFQRYFWPTFLEKTISCCLTLQSVAMRKINTVRLFSVDSTDCKKNSALNFFQPFSKMVVSLKPKPCYKIFFLLLS